MKHKYTSFPVSFEKTAAHLHLITIHASWFKLSYIRNSLFLIPKFILDFLFSALHIKYYVFIEQIVTNISTLLIDDSYDQSYLANTFF